MSLYNRLFGENEDAVALLGMINLTRNKFVRYRDVYLNKEGTKIIVLTRLGGANREDYFEIIENVKANPYYIKDYDDEFDNTYAYFEFKVPEKYADTCKKIAPKEDRLNVGDMFKKEVEEAKIPGSGASKRADAIAEEIFKAMEGGLSIIDL